MFILYCFFSVHDHYLRMRFEESRFRRFSHEMLGENDLMTIRSNTQDYHLACGITNQLMVDFGSGIELSKY